MPNATRRRQISSTALLNQVVHVAALTHEQIHGVLAEFDLTESLARVLWALDPDAPPATMRELARKLRYDPSNVTLMATKLEETGLVERLPHPTDGRVRILALTEQGQRVWNALIERLEATSPVLSLTRAEQKQLSALLAKVEAAATQPTPRRRGTPPSRRADRSMAARPRRGESAVRARESA